ncbi:M1 family metallopeptidase [Fundidesulfovibrio terrae]|uniref:M1 family metallopeptidase n=1 Tax=Fundidesulfovibrio terrae TaxID=2922866 RepID=UPI001FAF76AC|nr:M1 family aminopeptidase [Fundidesulfovibrio terrae]
MRTPIPVILAVLLAFAPCAALAEAARHSLDASFDLPAKRLAVTDIVALVLGTPPRLTIELSSRATGLAITADAKPVRFARSGTSVTLSPPPGARELRLHYTLPLDAPPASLPATTDNPGADASDAACGPDWAMLMPASLWHPVLEGGENAYAVRVSAPSGIKAVTQGSLSGFAEEPGRTVSAWDIPRPEGRLGLCLARYDFQESRVGPVPVQTFLLEGSARLAPVYLEASARHLRFYSDLHGPYAFEKFAVAENPLPTGYGFPSYTLLGSQVLALPFIPETSLRHEIAHSWWGNGVLVDYDRGNWCEGLTTYVADYTAQAEQSPQAARTYRLKTLRAFADLVREGGDMPLDRFGSRYSPASQAVGYGKTLFVFHMLRAFVGDEAFFQGLRRLYADSLFKPASWEDIRKVFAGMPGFDEPTSRAFFSQWLTRTGGPRLKIACAQAAPNGTGGTGGYTLRATVTQEGDPYLLNLNATVETDAGPVRTPFIMDGASKELALDVPGKPSRLVLDPGADCFRMLAPSEVPPSVNTVKGSGNLTVVMAASAPEALRQALPRLLAGLGQEKARVVEEGALTPAKLETIAKGGLLVVGAPSARVPGFADARPKAPGADTVFAVLPRTGGFTAVFQAKDGAGIQDVATAAAKVTHYGSYGVLGFDKGRNVVKDTPEPPESPMIWEFQER